MSKQADVVFFDFGEWKSPMPSRKDPDGSTSFVTVATGMLGLPFVVGSQGGKRSLTLRDAQHEYTFLAE